MDHPSHVPFTQVLHAAMQSQNRRRDSRYRVSTPAAIWFARDVSWENRRQDETLRVVMMESISGSGLSFMTESAFDPGAEVWIRFQIGSKVCQLKGIVRHVMPRPIGKGRCGYLCGIEFTACCQTVHAQNILAGYLTSGRSQGAASS
jgi:hypothetical protein